MTKPPLGGAGKPVLGYQLESHYWAHLKKIEKKLYDYRPLTPDERRDLANLLNYVLSQGIEVYDEDSTQVDD